MRDTTSNFSLPYPIPSIFLENSAFENTKPGFVNWRRGSVGYNAPNFTQLMGRTTSKLLKGKDRTSQFCYLKRTPPELMTEIFSRLDVLSLLAFSATCRYVYTCLHSTSQNWRSCDLSALSPLVDARVAAFLSLGKAGSGTNGRGRSKADRSKRHGSDDSDSDWSDDDDDGEYQTSAKSSVEYTEEFPTSTLPPSISRHRLFLEAVRSLVVDSTSITHHILALVFPRMPNVEHLSAKRCPRLDIMRLAVTALVMVLDREKQRVASLVESDDSLKNTERTAEEEDADLSGLSNQEKVPMKYLSLRSLHIRGSGRLSSSTQPSDSHPVARSGPGLRRGTLDNQGLGEPGNSPRAGEVSALRALTRALSAISRRQSIYVDLCVCESCQDAVSIVSFEDRCKRCKGYIIQTESGTGGICGRCSTDDMRCGSCRKILICAGCSKDSEAIGMRCGRSVSDGGPMSRGGSRRSSVNSNGSMTCDSCRNAELAEKEKARQAAGMGSGWW